MRKILVSGAAGFLGRWLIRELEPSWRVVGTDLAAAPPRPDLEWMPIEDESDGLLAVVERPDLPIVANTSNGRPRASISRYPRSENEISTSKRSGCVSSSSTS